MRTRKCGPPPADAGENPLLQARAQLRLLSALEGLLPGWARGAELLSEVSALAPGREPAIHSGLQGAPGTAGRLIFCGHADLTIGLTLSA